MRALNQSYAAKQQSQENISSFSVDRPDVITSALHGQEINDPVRSRLLSWVLVWFSLDCERVAPPAGSRRS